MTWKLTEWGKTRAGVTGVTWRDMSDEEFEDVEGLFAPGELRAQGYFEYVADAEAAPISPQPATRRPRRKKP